MEESKRVKKSKIDPSKKKRSSERAQKLSELPYLTIAGIPKIDLFRFFWKRLPFAIKDPTYSAVKALDDVVANDENLLKTLGPNTRWRFNEPILGKPVELDLSTDRFDLFQIQRLASLMAPPESSEIEIDTVAFELYSDLVDLCLGCPTYRWTRYPVRLAEPEIQLVFAMHKLRIKTKNVSMPDWLSTQSCFRCRGAICANSRSSSFFNLNEVKMFLEFNICGSCSQSTRQKTGMKFVEPSRDEAVSLAPSGSEDNDEDDFGSSSSNNDEAVVNVNLHSDSTSSSSDSSGSRRNSRAIKVSDASAGQSPPPFDEAGLRGLKASKFM